MPKGSVQAEKGRVRREEIVDAAMTVFSTHGFRGGALTVVAEAVGITPAAILYHFGSKEDLLLAVIQERDRRAGVLGADLTPERGLDTLRESVRFAEYCEADPGLATLHTVLQVENYEAGSPVHEYFERRSRYLRRNMERTLSHAKSAGDIRDDVDVVAMAQQIIAFLEGAAVLWLIDPQVSLVDLYRNYFDTVIREMTTR